MATKMKKKSSGLIQESCDKLGIPIPRDAYVNPLILALRHEWNERPVPDPLGYRGRAISRCLESRVSFSNESNTTDNLIHMLLRVECPGCHGQMESTGGCGGCAGPGGSSWNASWRCEGCGVEVGITMGGERSIRVRFNDDNNEVKK